jgi:hypothetical protein
MECLDYVVQLLFRGCFTEAMYFSILSVMKAPTASAHMLAGVSCCGGVVPLGQSQKLLEGVNDGTVYKEKSELPVSTDTALYYEGFFHLLQTFRIDPSIRAPIKLIKVFDDIADNLAYISRRELHVQPANRKRYTLRLASVAAAILIRRLTGSKRELPGVMPTLIDYATEIINTELNRTGGDAVFFYN